MAINLFKVAMSQEAIDASAKVLSSGFIGQGPVVDQFEEALKKEFNNDYVVTTNSGTSALHLCMHIAKTRDPSKKVVLATPLTCTATNWPILANGLEIKWVDVDKDTLNMDLDDLERKMGPDVAGIILVHWGGNPIDLDRVSSIVSNAKEQFSIDPVVVQDCAHAYLSKYNGSFLERNDMFSVYSFQAIKHLTSGDGGMIICPDLQTYDRLKLLRWYGIDREGDRKDFRCEGNISEWGFKFHMNDINASIGLANMDLARKNVARHQEIAQRYTEALQGTLLDPYVVRSKDKPAYWLYTVKVNGNRESLMQHLKEREITSSRVHERNDKHSCVREFKSLLPGLEEVSKNMLCIPCGWWLTDEEVSTVIKAIKEWKP